MLTDEQKEFFMQSAIEEAKKAAALGEVPIGCVIVFENRIIARGYNLREKNHDAVQHAEIIAIQAANKRLHNWRLEDTQLFVTLEPCPMCAGAIINARIPEVYYGAPDSKAGAAGTLLNLLTDKRFNHQVIVEKGICRSQCVALLTDFFQTIRIKRDK